MDTTDFPLFKKPILNPCNAICKLYVADCAATTDIWNKPTVWIKNKANTPLEPPEPPG